MRISQRDSFSENSRGFRASAWFESAVNSAKSNNGHDISSNDYEHQNGAQWYSHSLEGDNRVNPRGTEGREPGPV